MRPSACYDREQCLITYTYGFNILCAGVIDRLLHLESGSNQLGPVARVLDSDSSERTQEGSYITCNSEGDRSAHPISRLSSRALRVTTLRQGGRSELSSFS